MDVPTRRPPGTRALAGAVLAAAILQVLAPVVTINGRGSSPGEGAGPELLITPVGWAFSIWGVIYALAVAQALAVLVRGAGSVPRRLQVAQLVLYLGGALWIVLAGLDSSLATAAALALMLGAALVAVLTAARTPLERGWSTVLTRAAVGLYAGWVTAAFFLNVSTALVAAGATEPDVLGWQLVVVAIAVLTLLAVTVATRGLPAYGAAGTWALVGIAVTAAADSTTTLLVVAVVCAVVLATVTVVVHYAHGEHRNSGRRVPVG